MYENIKHMITKEQFLEAFNENKQKFIDELNAKYFGTGEYGIKRIEFRYIACGMNEDTNKSILAYKFTYTENSGKWNNELYLTEDFHLIEHSFGFGRGPFFKINKYHKFNFEKIVKNL